jgi:hypothetical protein
MPNRQQIRSKTTTGAPAAQDLLTRELCYNDVDNKLYIKKINGTVQELVNIDGWTYLKLGSDFVTSSATAVDVTGLAFTPAANTQFEFMAVLFLRTATATVGPRTGLAWPTGLTDGVATLNVPTSGTAQVLVFGNRGAALLAAVGGLPNTTSSYPSTIVGSIIAGESPSGTLKVQMASETAGTNVTVKAGSFLKYRSI